ncbi:Sodium- and chloride-dependent neutral and basic amino acid transporter B(0+),Sodium-dependent proline transporter,Sodium- and chloride-dependent glycine transporter 2,Sodium- and chloride-dependent glycine transporter 1 [Mytilus coruscus]|uniref:Transporter n=1 Tax=Mytilus coruscus TaxID=42192 RepID=A0A6J8AWZ9_MYTCO|nr:Sodium- and chloride-dependent neutral and basic amino acid transporter B(0+),Sodium-dependent proline transporter,Sodium- and chloride-dependent glycine transporter 2,Sodium- and chloride-dependent glycine transporter 1 [Mytilus coruscus]
MSDIYVYISNNEIDTKDSYNVNNGLKERNGDVDVNVDKDTEDRGQWGSKWEFILSSIGLSVGLGNVWRFPYLAYENGGAAFLITYLVLQFLIGKPMYFMELVMGQFSGLGPTGVWKMNPSTKGIGISMALISLVVAIYYNECPLDTCITYQGDVPITCITLPIKEMSQYLYVFYQGDVPGFVSHTKEMSHIPRRCPSTCITYQGDVPVPVSHTKEMSQYLYHIPRRCPIKLINKADTGNPQWKLALCLLLSWIVVVVLCLVRGIKSSGKVVYFTATFPYVILLILLIRGATLDGMGCCSRTDVFSLSVSFGGIIMFGSYNKFSNNVYGDALLIAVMDLVTSIIAGFVIFTTFGGLAKKTGLQVSEVARGGYGLAFVAYPEALSNLPLPQLWSVLFFFMLFTLGLDSEFALLETVLTCIQDEFPKLRKYKSHMCIRLGVICFFMTLPCITPDLYSKIMIFLPTHNCTKFK